VCDGDVEVVVLERPSLIAAVVSMERDAVVDDADSVPAGSTMSALYPEGHRCWYNVSGIEKPSRITNTIRYISSGLSHCSPLPRISMTIVMTI
jgi:hypothetical protein